MYEPISKITTAEMTELVHVSNLRPLTMPESPNFYLSSFPLAHQLADKLRNVQMIAAQTDITPGRRQI